MAGRVLEMAIAIKGKLDGSLGSAMSQAVAQSQQLQKQIRSINADMAKAQKAASYGDVFGQVQAIQLAEQKNEITRRYDTILGSINKKKAAAARFDRATSQLKTGAVAVGVSAAPLIAATQAAMQFESAMSDVRKTVDFDTPEQFKQMNQDILTLSQNLPMSAEGIAKIVAAGGQAGIARDQLQGFAQDAVKMGIAFDITADQAGEMMAKWRTAFGMSQDQVVTLADQVNYLSNVTAASSGDISDIVTRVGPLGEVAGVNAAQIAAMGASMSSVGVQSDVAATGIKNMMLGLVAGEGATNAQAAAFEALGLSATDVAQRMQTDAQGTIVDVLQRIQNLPKEAQASTLADLFGTESIGAIAPLLTQLDNLKTNFQRVGDAAQYAGSMEAEYQARSQTTSNQLQLAKNNVMALAINIGSILLPTVNSFLQRAAGIAGTVARWAGANQGVVATIIAVVGAIAGLTMAALTIRAIASWFRLMKASIDLVTAATNRATIAQRVNAVTTRVSAMATTLWSAAARGAAIAQAILNAVMSANPFVIVAIAIIALVGYLIYLWNTNEEFRAAVQAAWAAITAAVSAAWDAITSAAAAAWDFITSAVDSGYSFIAGIFDSISSTGAAVWDAVVSAAQSAWNTIISVVSDGVNWCIDKWNTLKELFSSPVQAVVNFVKGGDTSAAAAAGQSAAGGVFTHPYLTWVAEAGHPEVIVPITHDANAYNLWAKAGQMLGITPQAMARPESVPSGVSGRGNTMEFTFAPNLTVNGGDANLKQQLNDLLNMKMAEFEQMMKRVQDQQRRVSFG